MIKIIIIEEFLQESGFEKREKYFDWLTGGAGAGGGGGRGTTLSCRSAVVLYRISEVVFWGTELAAVL